MNRTDRRRAERLLGGYAAGILTPEERTLLFSAALEHQELFDALADEEALRELLADPGVRERLLALLAPAPARTSWRRPAYLGLAASLLAMVTTSVVLWRNKAFEKATPPRAPHATPLLDTEPPKQEAPSQEAAAGKRTRSAPARKPEPPATAPAAPLTMPLPAADLALEEKPRAAETLHKKAARHDESRKERAPEPPEAATRGGTARPWTLEAAGEGRERLTVTTPSAVCVLLRRGAQVSVLSPSARAPHASGATTWSFEFPVKDGVAVDLYLLARPVPDPAALPADGPVDGTRTRIWPR